MFKKKWYKILIICFSVLIIYGVMQSFQPKNIVLKATPSYFIKNNIFIPIATVSMFLTFVVISSMFLRIQSGLQYSKISSGLLFSISFIGFWFVGMFEPYLLFNEAINFCLFLGVVDSLALLLLGLLLGNFIKENSDKTNEKLKMTNIVKILIIAFFYVFGRLFSYKIIGVKSSIDLMPLENMLWIIAIGLSTGFLFWISYNANEYTPVKKSIWFGLSYFGVIWIIYNSFNPLFVKYELFGIGKISLVDLYIKTGIDICFITVGILFVESFFRKETLNFIRKT